MKRFGLLIIAGVAIISLAALVFLMLASSEPSGSTTLIIDPPAPQSQPQSRTPEPATATRAVTPPAPSAIAAIEPVVEPEPAIAAPAQSEATLEPPQASTGAELELPSLNDSDGFVIERLRALRNGAALLGLIADQQLIRKFVVFADNISRHEFPQTDLPYRPIGIDMPVRELDQNLFLMEADAHSRFNGFIDAMAAVETEQAFALYSLLRPLFQQAYAELGYRGRDFDDTLREAVNNVLRATDTEGPYQLVKPSVMYLFADSELENADAVHKQLIRIGPRNSTRLMGKLAEFVVLL